MDKTRIIQSLAWEIERLKHENKKLHNQLKKYDQFIKREHNNDE